MLTIIPYKANIEDLQKIIVESNSDNTLFLFNDCIEHHCSYKQGVGNSVLRQYNQYNTQLAIPKSAGIPMGSIKNGGFKYFTNDVKHIIDQSFDKIIGLIHLYKYSQIVYPSYNDGKLRVDNFFVNKDIIDYVTQKILNLNQEI